MPDTIPDGQQLLLCGGRGARRGSPQVHCSQALGAELVHLLLYARLHYEVVHIRGLGLADAVHTPHSLRLYCWIQQRLHNDDMLSLCTDTSWLSDHASLRSPEVVCTLRFYFVMDLVHGLSKHAQQSVCQNANAVSSRVRHSRTMQVDHAAHESHTSKLQA